MQKNKTNLNPHKHLQGYIRQLIKTKDTKVHCFICYGPGGTGKTYTVGKALDKAGIDYKLITCKATPPTLVKALYENRSADSFIVFDDVAELLRNTQMLDIFKAATYPDAKGERRVQYNSTTSLLDDEMKDFVTECKVIIISNDKPGVNPNLAALESRSWFYDFDPPKTVRKQMLESALPTIGKGLRPADRTAILEYIYSNAPVRQLLNYRTLIKGCELFVGAKKAGEDWQELLDPQLTIEVKKKSNLEATVREIRMTYEKPKEQIAAFYRLTGLGRRQWYRYKEMK